jgi:hypothetical protein
MAAEEEVTTPSSPLPHARGHGFSLPPPTNASKPAPELQRADARAATSHGNVAAAAATCDRRCCYIKLPVLLHAGAAVATSGRRRATCSRRCATSGSCRSYIRPPALLHGGPAIATSSRRRGTSGGRRATCDRRRATCGRRCCYRPAPPSLHQVVGVLHYAATVATLRRRCCYMLLSSVLLPAGADDTASGRRHQGVAGSAAGESGG